MKKTLSKSDQEKFSKAQKLTKQGNAEAVMKIMEELVLSNPSCGILRAILANTYKELNDINRAEEEFKKAITLESNSEKVSLGLFHCLLEQGKEQEAFCEMDRFMKVSDCDDYREIKEEIIEKYGSIKNYLERKLADQFKNRG